MTTIDQIIINWFNTGFGGAAPVWVGNLVLFFLSILLTIIFAGVIAAGIVVFLITYGVVTVA